MAEEGDQEGGNLGAMTYQCVFNPVFDRLEANHAGNPEAVASINQLRSTLQCADQASPSFLHDLMRTLVTQSELNVNFQESFLRLQENAPTEDLEIPMLSDFAEFQELSARAIAFRNILSRIPEEMGDRRTFLNIIQEIASAMKMMLDATTTVIEIIPPTFQHAVERCKREFVRDSKEFRRILKEHFCNNNTDQVTTSANQLIFKTAQIVRTVRDKLQLSVYPMWCDSVIT
uniref:DUF1394 domain-containing protein n=1 Tax=Steinernema glaseri TaxID=37863 RepID=A0A1I8AK31_9BILA